MPGFTSAADLEEDKLDENANPLAINGSGDQPSSSEFRHGHPIAGNAGAFFLPLSKLLVLLSSNFLSYYNLVRIRHTLLLP